MSPSCLRTGIGKCKYWLRLQSLNLSALSKFFSSMLRADLRFLHRIMREYMPKRGTLGRDMMFRSTTIQVSA